MSNLSNIVNNSSNLSRDYSSMLGWLIDNIPDITTGWTDLSISEPDSLVVSSMFHLFDYYNYYIDKTYNNNTFDNTKSEKFILLLHKLLGIPITTYSSSYGKIFSPNELELWSQMTGNPESTFTIVKSEDYIKTEDDDISTTKGYLYTVVRNPKNDDLVYKLHNSKIYQYSDKLEMIFINDEIYSIDFNTYRTCNLDYLTKLDIKSDTFEVYKSKDSNELYYRSINSDDDYVYGMNYINGNYVTLPSNIDLDYIDVYVKLTSGTLVKLSKISSIIDKLKLKYEYSNNDYTRLIATKSTDMTYQITNLGSEVRLYIDVDYIISHIGYSEIDSILVRTVNKTVSTVSDILELYDSNGNSYKFTSTYNGFELLLNDIKLNLINNKKLLYTIISESVDLDTLNSLGIEFYRLNYDKDSVTLRYYTDDGKDLTSEESEVAAKLINSRLLPNRTHITKNSSGVYENISKYILVSTPVRINIYLSDNDHTPDDIILSIQELLNSNYNKYSTEPGTYISRMKLLIAIEECNSSIDHIDLTEITDDINVPINRLVELFTGSEYVKFYNLDGSDII